MHVLAVLSVLSFSILGMGASAEKASACGGAPSSVAGVLQLVLTHSGGTIS
jgi:hypothetical protein